MPRVERLDPRLPVFVIVHLADEVLRRPVEFTQYTAGAYRAALHAAGAVASMSRTGNWWDHEGADSFFATLEHELIADDDWATHTQAHGDIFVFIEEWSNRERQHSSLGYVSPVQYEQERFAHSARAA